MTRVRSFHRCLHNATAWITLLVVFALSSLFGGTIGCVPDNGTLSTLSNGDESTDATDDGSVDTNPEITDDEVNVADLTTAEVEVSSDFSGSDTGDSGDTGDSALPADMGFDVDADAIGATLTLTSTPARGTVAELVMPLIEAAGMDEDDRDAQAVAGRAGRR